MASSTVVGTIDPQVWCMSDEIDFLLCLMCKCLSYVLLCRRKLTWLCWNRFILFCKNEQENPDANGYVDIYVFCLVGFHLT